MASVSRAGRLKSGFFPGKLPDNPLEVMRCVAPEDISRQAAPPCQGINKRGRCVETSREAAWSGIFCRESGGETQGYRLAVVIDHGRGVLDVGMNGFSPDHG